MRQKADAKEVMAAAARERAKPFPKVAPVTLTAPNISTTLWPRTPPADRGGPQEPRRRAFDIGNVINRALTAAGLKK